MAVADAVAGPIVKSLPGKAAVPDDHPFTTGCIGVLDPPSEEALAEADTLLLVGTSSRGRPTPDPARSGPSRSTDPARLGGSGAAEVILRGTPPRPWGRCCRSSTAGPTASS